MHYSEKHSRTTPPPLSHLTLPRGQNYYPLWLGQWSALMFFISYIISDPHLVISLVPLLHPMWHIFLISLTIYPDIATLSFCATLKCATLAAALHHNTQSMKLLYCISCAIFWILPSFQKMYSFHSTVCQPIKLFSISIVQIKFFFFPPGSSGLSTYIFTATEKQYSWMKIKTNNSLSRLPPPIPFGSYLRVILHMRAGRCIYREPQSRPHNAL